MERPHEIDRYIELASPFHSFDPRAKIVSFLFLILSIVLLRDLKLCFVGFFVALLFLFFSKVPLRFFTSYMRWIFPFVFLFIVIMPFTVEGKEIFSLYNLKFTYEGLKYGTIIALRATSAAILVFVVVSTTRFADIMKALYELKVPNLLIQMLMFSHRYIFVLREEAQKMLIAMRSRGFDIGTNLYSLRNLGRVIGMLFIRSYERADRVYHAMRARGYGGKPEVLTEFTMRAKDWALSLFIFAISISLHMLVVP